MSNNHLASICFIIACVAICGFSRELGSYLCLAIAICLYGFIVWLDHYNGDRDKKIQADLDALRSRIETLEFAKSMRK